LADKAQQQQDGVDAKQEKKNAKARKFARTWLPLARTAEAAFKARQGTALRGGGARPSTSPLRGTTVGDMKTLIVGRTGELPKAKNNKDGAMKSELLGILDAPMILKTPPPSPEKRGAAAEKSDSSSDSSSDGSNGGMDLDGLGAFGDAAE
jgi:hypothetical protein